MVASPVHILDTTLRDGSYTIDFQFTAEDTANIVSGLETAGIRWIEVGHGLGLGASRSGRGKAAASDEAYMHAAAEALSTAKFGPFFIPGIGTKEDIDRAVNCGAHFIRIGTDPHTHDVKAGLPFIEYAKEQGLIVFANLMKSYLVPPKTFAQNAAHCAKAGADCVYIMDSAGGMLPEEIDRYIKETLEQCSSPLGFHGHDNLSMAIANSLQALKSGAQFVDGSLQGLGRSAGNATMEALISVLQLQGHCSEINSEELVRTGQKWITPLSVPKAHHGLSVLSGRAKVHSAIMPILMEVAEQAHITPETLLLKISETGTLNPNKEHLEQLAQAIQDESS